MSVNPYVYETLPTEMMPEAIARRIQTSALEPLPVPVKGQRKTNWFTMAGAVVGLAIGLYFAQYPPANVATLPSFDQGRAYGQVLGYVVGNMFFCGIAGWLVSAFLKHPIRTLCLSAALMAVIVLAAFALPLRQTLPSKVVDLGRHKQPGRVQAGSNPFSFVPPAGWRSTPGKDFTLLRYIGPAQSGFAANLGLYEHPSPGRINGRLVEMEARKTLPKSATLVAVGDATIDGKEAYFVTRKIRDGGRKVWHTQYLIPSSDKLYRLTFCYAETASKEIEPAMNDLVRSICVD